MGDQFGELWDDRYKFPKKEGRLKRAFRRTVESAGYSPELAGEAFTFLRTGSTTEEYTLLHEELTPEKLTKLKARIAERRKHAQDLSGGASNWMQMRGLHVDGAPTQEQVAEQVEKMRELVANYDQTRANQQARAQEKHESSEDQSQGPQ